MKKSFHDKQQFIFYAVIVVIFCLMLLLNCLTPMAADDYNFSFIRNTNERVDSFSDIFVSSWIYYLEAGGRFQGNFIAQIFLWWGKPLFNVFNSIVFVLYINLISYFSFGKRSIVGVLCSFLLVWFMIPVPGQVLFWLDGSCNYLWGGTLVFLFIYRYYRNILKPEKKTQGSFFLTLLWFLFGIIMGWCNENTSGMGILICCLLTLYSYKLNKQIPLWKIVGILGAVLSFIVMIAAPGNAVRASTYDLPASPLIRLISSAEVANRKAFGSSGDERILFFVFLFAYVFLLILPKINREKKIIGGIWFLGALACNYAMALSPDYADRTSFGVFSMYFVSVLYSSRTLVEYFDTKILMDIAKTLLCVSLLYFSVSYPIAAGDIALTYVRDNRRVEIVLEEKSKGNYDIAVPAARPKTKYNVFFAIEDWTYHAMPKYFGINSIQLIDQMFGF